MLVALHPEQPSAPLVEALLAAGCRPVPVADAAAVADQEPEGGWAALVVELGDDPTAALSLARRVRGDGGAPVLRGGHPGPDRARCPWKPATTSCSPPSTPANWPCACAGCAPWPATSPSRM